MYVILIIFVFGASNQILLQNDLIICPCIQQWYCWLFCECNMLGCTHALNRGFTKLIYWYNLLVNLLLMLWSQSTAQIDSLDLLLYLLHVLILYYHYYIHLWWCSPTISFMMASGDFTSVEGLSRFFSILYFLPILERKHSMVFVLMICHCWTWFVV